MKLRSSTLLVLSVTLVAGGIGPSGCDTEPDELCLGDPCVITGTHVIEPFSFLDFDGRAVVLDGTLDIGSGFVSITAASLRMTPAGQILSGSLSVPGGTIEISVDGDLAIEGTSGAAIDMRGAPGGGILLESLEGSITSGRGLRASASTADPFGGEITLRAGRDILVDALLDAEAGSFTGAAGTILLDAGRDVRVGSVDVDGGAEGEGTFEVFAFGDARIGPVSARGAGSGGIGGQIAIEARGSLRIDGALQAQGSSSQGEGGFIDLLAGSAGRSGLLELLATARVDVGA